MGLEINLMGLGLHLILEFPRDIHQLLSNSVIPRPPLRPIPYAPWRRISPLRCFGGLRRLRGGRPRRRGGSLGLVRDLADALRSRHSASIVAVVIAVVVVVVVVVAAAAAAVVIVAAAAVLSAPIVAPPRDLRIRNRRNMLGPTPRGGSR